MHVPVVLCFTLSIGGPCCRRLDDKPWVVWRVMRNGRFGALVHSFWYPDVLHCLSWNPSWCNRRIILISKRNQDAVTISVLSLQSGDLSDQPTFWALVEWILQWHCQIQCNVHPIRSFLCNLYRYIITILRKLFIAKQKEVTMSFVMIAFSTSFASSCSHVMSYITIDLQQKPGSWNFHRLMYHEVPVPSKSHKLTSISTCRLGRFTLLLIIFDKTTSEDASSWFVPAWRHTRTHTLTHTLGFQMKLEFCWPAKDALQPKDPKTLEKSVLVWGSVFHHEGRLKAKHMEETWTNFRSVWQAVSSQYLLW